MCWVHSGVYTCFSGLQVSESNTVKSVPTWKIKICPIISFAQIVMIVQLTKLQFWRFQILLAEDRNFLRAQSNFLAISLILPDYLQPDLSLENHLNHFSMWELMNDHHKESWPHCGALVQKICKLDFSLISRLNYWCVKLILANLRQSWTIQRYQWDPRQTLSGRCGLLCCYWIVK